MALPGWLLESESVAAAVEALRRVHAVVLEANTDQSPFSYKVHHAGTTRWVYGGVYSLFQLAGELREKPPRHQGRFTLALKQATREGNAGAAAMRKQYIQHKLKERRAKRRR